MVSLRLRIVFTFSILFSVLLMPGMSGYAQGCTTLGQTPATAFPVCGSATFTQSSVPACVNNIIPVPGCSSQVTYEDLNPYWYKFTCFVSGTLALTIAPKKGTDDYDWQLFDITGHNPNDVYTNSGLFLACNWSGLTGTTGTSSTASSLTECSSFNTFNPPIFSKMPNLIQGHNYLLLISHFSGDSQSGYDLSFYGGTASITDTVPPALKSIQVICDDKLQIVLNKKMKCSSLAADGSDFSVNSATVSVISAVSTSCSNGFDMDTVELMLSGHLAPGNYTITASNGTDGNTVLDNCDAEVPAGSALPFQLAAPQPTPLDSLTTPGCAPNVLQLVFPRKIMCSSIASNGSDFAVTGPSPVTISGASANCDASGEGNVITVQLSAPIVNGGNYQIKLADGIDGNTIIDECGLSTPAGAIIPFSLGDTVSAVFDDQVKFGCKADTIQFFYTDKNGVDQWLWSFGDNTTGNVEDPFHIYPVFGDKSIRLIVSNGFCSDTATSTVALDNAIHASFEAPSILCPTDAAVIKDNSTGKNLSYTWNFDDGTGSSDAQPADHTYPILGAEKKYDVSLVIGNVYGCYDTAVWQIDVLRSCYIAVPSAFTPNGDGMNDYLYPLNAYKADHLEFRVYNRYGQLVFTGRDWLQKWDGTINGHPEPAGTYVWMLQYTDRDTGRKVFQKGTAVLIR